MTARSYKTVEAYHLGSQEGIPHHLTFPVLIYGGVLDGEANIEHTFERVFSENAWDDFHRRRIFGTDHFNSGTHEVLGVVSGHAVLKLGGTGGKKVELREGDLILLPAGTAHRMIASSSDFRVVSAFPEGQENEESVNLEAVPVVADQTRTVTTVPQPKTDPFFGHKGPLFDFWYD